MKTKRIVIIGGGIIGLFSAYYLSEEGHEIILLDQLPESSESNCSARNAGMIVPSHFVPLASPGILKQGLRWMLDKRSPFYLHPSLNLRTLRWLYRFWKSATAEQAKMAHAPLLEINRYGLNLYKLLSQHPEMDFGFRQQGLLMICRTEHALEEESRMARIAGQLGLETEVLDRKSLLRHEPGIGIDAAGAVHYPGDAHLDPGRLIRCLKQNLTKKRNVSLLTNQSVSGFETASGKISRVVTGLGRKFGADEFILAAGIHSYYLAAGLDLRLPMLAGKGYSLTIPQNGQRLRTPSILAEARVAVTPLGENIRFGGTMELGAENDKINPARIEGIIRSAGIYFPDLDIAPLKSTPAWSGMRPCAPDGLPYIGRFGKYTNLIAATGHSMMGLSMAPATGKIMADLVTGRRPEVGLNLYSPDRYK